MSALTYKPQLDGLRAIAVAAVAWSHWEPAFQFGVPFGAGVHLFFVLSGFLITNILLDVRDRPERGAALRAFYVRRALRIFPAFYLTLGLAWIADVPLARETLAWHAAYLSNVLVFVTGSWQGSLSHFWSLAVEEQFYLVWPWVIVFVPRRAILPAIIAATAAAPLFRWWLAAGGTRETLLAVLTPGCLDSLGMGALLGALTTGGTSNATRQRVRAWLGDWRLRAGSTAAFCALLFVEGGTTLPVPVLAIKQTLQAVVFAWIVFGAAHGFNGSAGRFLSSAPMLYVGRISYGVYLAHGFAGEILGAIGVSSRALGEPLRFLVLTAVTLAVASLSWYAVERPINACKARFPYGVAARYGLRRPSPVDSAP